VRHAVLTVGDALRAVRAIGPLAARDPYRGPWADADSELADLEDVLSALPQGWRAAADAATLPAPGALEVFLESDGLTPASFSRAVTPRELQVECGLVSGLGWRLGRNTIRVSELSVRWATGLQMRPYIEKRVQYRRDFVDSVAPVDVRGDPEAVAICYKSVVAAQRQLWKLRWDNHFKEVFWRLVVNGLATAERMHMQNNDCVCGPVVGGQPPGRRTTFGTARWQLLVLCSSSWLGGCQGCCSPSMFCA
jgi:hypothetical protein